MSKSLDRPEIILYASGIKEDTRKIDVNRSSRDSLTRWGNRALFFMNLSLCIMFLWIFSTRSLTPSTGIEYKDLIVIVLTAVAVLLAAVTLFVGALAIYGYATLRDLAERTAKDTAERVAPAAAAREAEVILHQQGIGQPTPDLVAELQSGEEDTSDA